MPTLFAHYIGIDYSGAATPESSLKGLRLYEGCHDSVPLEVEPPVSRRKYWSRKGLAHWLAERLAHGGPTMVGVDHGFSFPCRYFEAHQLEPDWPAFLDDFAAHWPTDSAHSSVEFIRTGLVGHGTARSGSARWRRLCELRARAKSVFHFDVPGSVAKSTHAGLPWLRYLRHELGERLHFWPFDGWQIPPGKSVIAEVYPSLWSKGYSRQDRTPDQHDAYVAASWLRQTDMQGKLDEFFEPKLLPQELPIAQLEGWILGVS